MTHVHTRMHAHITHRNSIGQEFVLNEEVALAHILRFEVSLDEDKGEPEKGSEAKVKATPQTQTPEVVIATVM